jgi:predicted DNA-binding transcriptional regulator AlpA
MPEMILRKTVAAKRCGLSVRHAERLEAAGKFPRRIKISDRAAGWLESDIAKFIAERVAESRGEHVNTVREECAT